jgi:hypothetical protein
LNPLKAKELVPLIAEQTGLPPDLLTDLHDFYWNHVRKCVTSLEDLHVMVPHLGTFGIKGDIVINRELDKFMPILNHYEQNIPVTATRRARHAAVKTKVEKLLSLKETYMNNQKKKEKIKQIRNEIRATNEAMERPQQDS